MAREIGSTIREFRRADLPAVKALVHQTIATCYPRHYCAEAVRFFLDYHHEEAILRDAREGRTIVLDKAGRILGTGSVVGDEIKRVFVDPAFQQQGFGRQIMQRLEAAAVARGITTVKLDASLPAKVFYDRLGYATIAAAFLPVENGRHPDFFKMEKML
jgi:GNAT superfamily N-acetyltransferase